MSFYADYIRERSDDLIIEDETGFVQYRYLNEKQVYIVEIYTIPECRRSGRATELAAEVLKLARAAGRSELIGTVDVKAKNCAESLKVMLFYGLQPFSVSGNLIVMRKDI